METDTKGKIVILADCFTKSEAERGLAAYANAGGDASKVIVAPVTEILMEMNTAEAVESILSGTWHGGISLGKGRRGALIAGADKRDTVALMRCFKSVLPKNSDAVFAMVTKTGAAWTVKQYFAHIRQEHEFMKTADPADDPDMKAIE